MQKLRETTRESAINCSLQRFVEKTRFRQTYCASGFRFEAATFPHLDLLKISQNINFHAESSRDDTGIGSYSQCAAFCLEN